MRFLDHLRLFWIRYLIGFIIIIGCLALLRYSGNITHFLANTIKNEEEDTSIDSVDIEDDYVPPESHLPKDINSIRSLIKKYIVDDTSFSISDVNDGVLSIEYLYDSNKYTYYLEYSDKFDCTTIRDNLNDETPIKILYHFEYESSEDFYNDIIKSIKNHSKGKQFNVTVTPDGEGGIDSVEIG